MIEHSLQRCFPALDQTGFGAVAARLPVVLDHLRKDYESGDLPLLRVPQDRADLDAAGALIEAVRESKTHVVILGTGGSGLGALALKAITPAVPPVELTAWDNLDPLSTERELARLPLETTLFLVISKSGSTAETISQFLAVLALMEERFGKDAAPNHFAAITEPGSRLLRDLCEARQIPVLEHHDGVGGRFAVLTTVGLVPAALMGLDPAVVREGAQTILDAALQDHDGSSAPAQGAALGVAAAQAGLNQTVMLGYADRFEKLIFWYRQLWAESLGKDGHGTTPVNGIGPVDQHSQLQLYLAGPADKLYTVLTTKVAGTGPLVPAEWASEPRLDYLAGRTIGDLVDAEQRATIDTLHAANRPVRTIDVPVLDEAAMGGLFMHFMLETILAAGLLGINAYDQPAVEDGKVRARAYLKDMA